MTLKVTWPQALAWRLERHMLTPIAGGTPEDVVRRLCGIQAQVASSAELAIRLRQKTSRAGEVARALSEGRLIKTWAMRATLHLLTPQDAGKYLSLMAATRWWEKPIWVRYFGVTPAQMEELRGVVREILGDRALTREELIAQIVQRDGFGHLGKALASGWGTIFKPLAWQGDICFGESRGNRVTFVRPEVVAKQWRGVPDVSEVWPDVVLAYLGAYGPATPDRFAAWLARGTVPKRQLKSWFAELGSQLTQVAVEGEPMFIRTADAEALEHAKPSRQVRLLGGFDQWVLGPGTDDGHVTPRTRRAAVSKQSGWISPVVVVGGVVTGTWALDGQHVAITWFQEAGKPPMRALSSEAARVSKIIGRELSPQVAAG